MTRDDKVALFRQMHEERRAFVMPNPWDLGSARTFAHLGFEALGTTSAGLAFSLGRLDQAVTRDEALAHASDIAAAVDLPVSGDFENGFADTPEGVAETVLMAAQAGLAGVSIEDLKPGGAAYDFDLAVARIEGAIEASRRCNILLCARADGIMERSYDLAEAERRLRAFAEAGAECIYAPALPDLAAIESICGIGPPVNVLMGYGPSLNVAQLRAARVGRISLGSALARTAYGAAYDAALEIARDHRFDLAEAGGRKTAFDAALERTTS